MLRGINCGELFLPIGNSRSAGKNTGRNTAAFPNCRDETTRFDIVKLTMAVALLKDELGHLRLLGSSGAI